MRAAALNNGDYIPDGKGGFLARDGAGGLLYEALFRLNCRRGAFPLRPELGSRLYAVAREKPSARDMAARQYAMEALEGLDVQVERAAVTVLDGDQARILVELRAEGETVRLEVTV